MKAGSVNAGLARGVWAIAVAKVTVHLAATSLGHHRDELYFIAASKRLSASYVDFQPVVPLLVRAVRFAFGESLLGLRVVPALAGGAAVVLGALLARELGGERRAQLLTAFALLVVPLFVGMYTMLNTVALETPAWLLVALVATRLLRTSDRRLWVPLGAAVGLALLVKFTVLAYLAALAVALLATPVRRHLRTPWPWVGAGVIAVIVGPSLVWHAIHGFPVVEFVRHQGGGGAILGLRGPLGFLVSLLILPGPVALFVLVPGLRLLLRRPEVRALGIAHVLTFALFFVVGGKGYYAAPGLAVLLAAGAVALAGRRRWSPRPLVIALVVNLLVPLPILFPGLLPMSVLRENTDLANATEIGERIGWEDFARTVARVMDSLDPDERSRAVVLGRNYAQSAAVEFYADRFDLPPAVSGHNSAYLWWPPIPRDHVVIAIGFDRKTMDGLYEDVRRAGTISNREGVRNYEWGEPVWVGRGPKVDPGELRERVRIFTA